MNTSIFYNPQDATILQWWLEGPELVIEHQYKDIEQSINYIRIPNDALFNHLITKREDIEEAIGNDSFYFITGGREFLFGFEEFCLDGHVDDLDIRTVFSEAVEFQVFNDEQWNQASNIEQILNMKANAQIALNNLKQACENIGLGQPLSPSLGVGVPSY